MTRELKMQLLDSAVVSEAIQEGIKNKIILKVQIIIYVLAGMECQILNTLNSGVSHHVGYLH